MTIDKALIALDGRCGGQRAIRAAHGPLKIIARHIYNLGVQHECQHISQFITFLWFRLAGSLLIRVEIGH